MLVGGGSQRLEVAAPESVNDMLLAPTHTIWRFLCNHPRDICELSSRRQIRVVLRPSTRQGHTGWAPRHSSTAATRKRGGNLALTYAMELLERRHAGPVLCRWAEWAARANCQITMTLPGLVPIREGGQVSVRGEVQ